MKLRNILFALLFFSMVGCGSVSQDKPRAGNVGTSTLPAMTSEWGIVISPCAWCDTRTGIEVHHIQPQHLYPERAHDTNNMICLCRRCHLVLGHRGNFTNAVTNLIIMIKEGKK
jgi:hypothetical protein